MDKKEKNNFLTTSINSTIYYNGVYWNDYYLVNKMINTKISGNSEKNWMKYLKERYCPNFKFKNILILNCGNGWVERELFGYGIFEKGIGLEYLEDLSKQAQREADKNNMPVKYIKMDINSDELPEEKFDLIINHAACHHIAYINKVMIKLSEIITDNGLFVNFDYVGPHRNLYTYEQWNEAWLLNKELPEHLQQNLRYPYIKSSIESDPSEAIHSELIIDVTKRYFNLLNTKN